MSTTLDQAFIKQFEREVHEAYQRQGSKLRNTVRTISNVNGSSAVFQKVGKGTASTKAANATVPVMNLDHSNIEVILEDYYAGDWVDHLDVGLTKSKVLEAFETFGEEDVPDDGQRFAIVGWKQWSDLLNLEEFVNSDYIGKENLPFASITQAKEWLGTIWMPHSGLPVDGDDIRSCYFYHKTAIGHAAATDVQTDVSWHGDRAAHFVNNMMSQGAGLIDEAGIIEIKCDETPD